MVIRTPSESIRQISDLLQQINRERAGAGQLTMGRAIDYFLDARQIARDALAAFRPVGEREQLIADFRVAMARIELAIDDLVRAQPDSTDEEDQDLVDAITEPLNFAAALLPDLEARERPGNPPIQ